MRREGIGTKKERQNSAKHQLEELPWDLRADAGPMAVELQRSGSSVGQGIRPEGGFDRGLIAGQVEIGILAQ